jgi:hypothetical protein
MQFVQFSQVSDCGYLQEIEIIFAGVTNVGDVTIEGRTPAIVLIDIAVPQQVAPPSERTCTFYGRRSHGHLPSFLRKNDQPFRSATLSGVMLFRSCTARCLRASNVVAAVGEVSAAPS